MPSNIIKSKNTNKTTFNNGINKSNTITKTKTINIKNSQNTAKLESTYSKEHYNFITEYIKKIILIDIKIQNTINSMDIRISDNINKKSNYYINFLNNVSNIKADYLSYLNTNEFKQKNTLERDRFINQYKLINKIYSSTEEELIFLGIILPIDLSFFD